MRTLLLPLALLSALAHADETALRFSGYAYEQETRKFLYTEVHDQRIEGDRWLGGTITYIAPDGSVIGNKTMNFTSDPFIPVYKLDLYGGRYIEGISAVSADSIEMFKKGYKDKEISKASLVRKGPVAADSGFHSFIRANFAELMAGKAVRFKFGVAGNLDAFKFRAKRIADGMFEGKPVVRFRVEPDTLLRLLVDPLELSYEPQQRKLLEYKGVSNLHDPSTGEAYNVTISYFSTPPPEAPKPPRE